MGGGSWRRWGDNYLESYETEHHYTGVDRGCTVDEADCDGVPCRVVLYGIVT